MFHRMCFLKRNHYKLWIVFIISCCYPIDKAYSNGPFNFQVFYVLVLTKILDLDWNITGIKNLYSSKKKTSNQVISGHSTFLKIIFKFRNGWRIQETFQEYKKISQNLLHVDLVAGIAQFITFWWQILEVHEEWESERNLWCCCRNVENCPWYLLQNH